MKERGEQVMSIRPASDIITGREDRRVESGPLATQRNTGKLLATQGYVVGIEISGNSSRQTVALADLDGNILLRLARPLKYLSDRQSVLQALDGMLTEVTQPERLQDGRILRVGMAVGGLIDAQQGVVRKLHHADGWDNFPLQDYLAERLAVPCIIDNNANAAALAEVVCGVGSGERVAFYIGLGQGIGSGLVVNGHIYHGATSIAGEIGHLLVKESGPECSCGGFGHLEAIASAEAIAHTMLKRSIEYPDTVSAIRRITGARAEALTVAQVFQLAAAGDFVAQNIIEEVQTYLAIALTNIVHMVNPSIIILGGAVAQAGDLLISPLQERVRALCLPTISQSFQIVQSSLGADANLVGAVILALQDIS